MTRRTGRKFMDMTRQDLIEEVMRLDDALLRRRSGIELLDMLGKLSDEERAAYAAHDAGVGNF